MSHWSTLNFTLMVISQTVIPFAGCFTLDESNQDQEKLVFVGLSDDQQSSYLQGCAQGPEKIRCAYDGNCYNATTESGVDLTNSVVDLGNWLPQGHWDSTADTYYQKAQLLFESEKIPFFAGGDHAVTIPVAKALDVLQRQIHIVQVDAHPDIYPELCDSAYSHACVASRLLEFDHIASITQIGIRTMNQVQKQMADKFQDRLHLLPARNLTGELPSLPHIAEGALVYLTIDLDGFDPVFAPGVSHPVPGGLSSRQVLNFIQDARWNLVGMDVVELNPAKDINNQTAILAARLMHEGMGYARRLISS
ncbi:arginase family protein [Raphidiopsis sp. BLCC-F218]